MKQFRNPFRGKACIVTALLLCGLFICRPVMAEERGFFTPRRTLGLAFLGGSALLAKQGVDFKSEADDFYERYEKATDQTEIDRLYRRTNNRDVKSQVSWALSAAFAVSGLRLVFIGGAETSNERQQLTRGEKESPVMGAVRGIEFESRLDPGGIGFSVKRRFF